MKVELFKNPNTYSGYFYYIRGNWNAISDVNTLIDVGTNDYIVSQIMKMNGGVGKKRVEQVILTHEHFDHAGGLKHIIKEWNPKVYAYKLIPGVTDKIYNGMTVKIGDRLATLYHTPGHSHDSISVYVEGEETIFLGDTAYNIKYPGGSYSDEYLRTIETLANLKISKLYSGHDEPITENANKILRNTLENVRKSKII